MEITDRIKQLKKSKDAVIMAHYYVPGEVQAVADYIGDSYYLSKVAETLRERVIVFCGVSFMGESAKFLSPDKKVLMPDLCADCPMAHMADKETIQKMRDTYDDLAVVCYINSTAELKQYADVCVTSANAVKIVKALPQKYIFFIPDRNLARYVAGQVPEKTFVYNEGFCPVHEEIRLEEVLEEKERHPEALILAHPECRKEVLERSDFVGSTSEILRYASKSGSREFIVCTEEGVSYRLLRDNPEKTFYFPKTAPVCADMKLNTLEKLLHVLEYEDNEVHVPEALQRGAVKPLKKMLELAK
ncbi:MAG TPA: quinolinate synthase [Lachnospiraceae bacterium]|nr:quinolinate synthase [Lachnospiraceae bacterium]